MQTAPAITFRRFRVEDLDHYRCKVVEQWAAEWFDAPGTKALEGDAYAFTAEIDDRPVASAGIRPIRHDVGVAWAAITPIPSKLAVLAHYKVKREIETYPWGRVETFVAWDFDISHRWVQRLGFALNEQSPSYVAPDRLYARYIYRGDR